MIRKVKFSNFYSFEKEQEISFLTSKKKSYVYFQSQVRKSEQITKIAGFIGGNASGKTNIMRLFSFFGYFVCVEGRKNDPDVGFKTFFNNKKISNFFIEFEIDKDLYLYEFSIKDNLILKERLLKKNSIKRSKQEEVFCRNHEGIEKLHENYFKNFKTDFLKNIRKDVSLISFLKAHYDIAIVNKIFNYFNIYSNINEHGDPNTPLHRMLSVDTYLKDRDIKVQVESFMRKFDIGLDGVEINKEKSDVSIFGLHRFDKAIHKLPFQYESRGTQSLFFMLVHIFKALKNNSIAIIDEIELGLHPEAIKKIIDYFIDENEKGKAQLIFSSHALDFLKKFDMQQIFLTEKKEAGNSILYRLDSVAGVRTDENFLAKYMTGAYGSFPDIKV